MKRVFLAVVVGLGCFLLAAGGTGCHSLPQVPDKANEVWQPPAGQQAEADGAWREGKVSRLDTSGAVVLADLLDQALSANPVLRKDWAEARKIEAQMRQTESAYYPKVNLTGKASQARSDANALEKEIDTGIFTPQASLTWLLLDAGGRRASVQAAAAQLLAANNSYNQTFQDLLLDVHSAYYGLYSAQASVLAGEDDLAAASKTLDAAKQKKAAGLGIQLDVLRAQTDYEQALYNLESARAAVATAKGQLARVVGLPADAALEIEPPQVAIPEQADWPEERLSAIMDEALAQRPDVAAARLMVQSAEYAVSASASDRWPTLMAGGQADKTWNRYSDDAIKDNDTQTYGGYLALSWDVFDGFLTVNKQREAEATAESAREQLRALELQASQSVWTKYYTLRAAIKKIALARATLQTAEQAYAQADDSYKAGLKDILFLLDAQSRLTAARSTAIDAEKEVYVAYVQMIHAVGKLGLQPEE